MKDKLGTELKVGDNVVSTFYDEENCECRLFIAPITNIQKDKYYDREFVILDVEKEGWVEYEDFEPKLDENDNEVSLTTLTIYDSDLLLKWDK